MADQTCIKTLQSSKTLWPRLQVSSFHFVVTSDSIDSSLLSFNATENSRDQKLVVTLCQNPLDADASKTTEIIGFLSIVEPE